MSLFGFLKRAGRYVSPKPDYTSTPVLFRLRSHTLFIISTVGIGLFTDLFLYGLVVPILPFMLTDRAHVPEDQIQSHTSALLAAYAAASVILSPFAGAIADKTNSRQLPFLAGLSALIVATIMLFLGQSVAVLTVARVFQGASSAFVWTIGLALCIDTVGPDNLGKTIGSVCQTRSLYQNDTFRTLTDAFSTDLQLHLCRRALRSCRWRHLVRKNRLHRRCWRCCWRSRD